MSTISISNVVGSTVTYTPDTTGNLVISTTGGIINASSLTGAIVLPSGSTNARPTGIAGTIRYNTTTAKLEAYVGGSWNSFP